MECSVVEALCGSSHKGNKCKISINTYTLKKIGMDSISKDIYVILTVLVLILTLT